MNTLDPLFGEPLLELLKASLTVREDFVFEFAAVLDETGIELEFRDVEAKHGFHHGGQLLLNQMAAQVKLADASLALVERLWILSDLGALRGWMPGALLTH
jgi:hypothetical protein